MGETDIKDGFVITTCHMIYFPRVLVFFTVFLTPTHKQMHKQGWQKQPTPSHLARWLTNYTGGLK